LRRAAVFFKKNPNISRSEINKTTVSVEELTILLRKIERVRPPLGKASRAPFLFFGFKAY
jgi:hypothetical protein